MGILQPGLTTLCKMSGDITHMYYIEIKNKEVKSMYDNGNFCYRSNNDFDTVEKAESFFKKKVQEKLNKGYYYELSKDD